MFSLSCIVFHNLIRHYFNTWMNCNSPFDHASRTDHGILQNLRILLNKGGVSNYPSDYARILTYIPAPPFNPLIKHSSLINHSIVTYNDRTKQPYILFNDTSAPDTYRRRNNDALLNLAIRSHPDALTYK